MTVPAQAFFASLTEQLNRGATRAALGLWSFRSDPLREHLRQMFQSAPGTGESFLADPVFEATFGWRPAEATLGGLAGKLLHPDVIKALCQPPRTLADEYTFPARRRPYQHQLEAWQTLITAQPPRSVLVSSGTGSGKTECFLIPILHDLATELTTRPGGLTGVRALFLYPLNALIKSQRDRLTAWTEPFGGRLRYCLYNGETPEEAKPTWASEVPDRKTLRASPPPILVTNATMLEYMLVRRDDQPILAQSQGTLRWIVIDEAHTYIGSQAAELTLLLRRVLHAFGCQADAVHFVATSATIAGSDHDARERLRTWLADIAGVAPERVDVIFGRRQVPPLPADGDRGQAPLPDLATLWTTLQTLSPQERFPILAADPRLRQWRSALVQQARTLSELVQVVGHEGGEEARHNTLRLLDLCTQAVNDQDEPFLPLRGHLFHRAISGLWACANATCTGRRQTPLDDPSWSFGQVFLERWQHCKACGSPVYELVQCSDCGAEYLSAVEVTADGGTWLRQRLSEQDEDEFQHELEPLDDDDIEDETPPIKRQHLEELPRLLVSPTVPQAQPAGLRADGGLDWDKHQGIQVHLHLPLPEGQDTFSCPCCNVRERRERLFRPIRLGAPFLLQTAMPVLLRHLPPYDGRSDTALPYDGRRLLSFTDSRQGTARFATKMQFDAERDFVRSLLYHSVADRGHPAAPQAFEAVRQEIAQIEQVIQQQPSLQGALAGTLADKRTAMQALAVPGLGRLPWQEAQDKLLTTDSFTRWLLPPLREQTFDLLHERQLAELCLWREFFLRPKRQFSLETLGLLRLDYPAVARIMRVPAVAAQHGVTLTEWQSLVRVAVDWQIRGRMSVAISHDMLRWIGYPGIPTVAVAAGQRHTVRTQRPWPSARTAGTRRSRLMRLLAYALGLPLEQKATQALLDELLHALWEAVRPLLSRTEFGYYLEPGQQAEIVQVRDAWLCPVTRRLLPVTFRGITPYLIAQPHGALARCQQVTMPVVPHPFWLDTTPDEVAQWLETDPAMVALRTLGVWTDLNDRIARFSPYFRSVEHSAQISGTTLSQRENEFKAGKLNLLSCSTTMEMGVDIGGLRAVAMNNVPPHPANFLQRAGRAGRRGEAVALSFTLCKSTPHGEAVFRHPLWPFTTRLTVPQVSLHSAPIVQRHANALTLAAFLTTATPADLRRLTAGWFFESESEDRSAPCEQVLQWCQSTARDHEALQRGLQHLLRCTCLEGRPVTSVLATTATMIQQAAEAWQAEIQALLDNQEIVKTRGGDSAPERAIKLQLERVRGEYLLSELVTRHVLPGYSFPTDVVSLITTTMEELSYQRRRAAPEREDNRAVRRGFPSRALALAIRDYAPGTDTVLDGRVYRSGGVTLNWHIPSDQEGPSEIQSLRWMWRCRSCGGNGTRPTQPGRCPHCGRDAQHLSCHSYLQPAGFAVDIRCKPHNNISLPQYIPVRDPLISLEGADWLTMPSPRLGRYRLSAYGALYHYTDGLHGQGYALCLRCGRAESMMPGQPPALPRAFADEHGQPVPHKRLRGGKNNDREQACPGSHEPWAIKQDLRLGLVTHTDMLELQLHNPVTGHPLDRSTASSLAVALQRALAQRLGIDEREIGCTIAQSRNAAGYPAYSLYLFDTASGGAGYVVQAVDDFPELFRQARHMLTCPSGCDTACQGCLLTYDTQHHIEDLDRHHALALLDETFLNALALPITLQAFGPSTRLEMEPLPLALRRELQRHARRDLRVFLGGSGESWEPLDWRLRDELVRLTNAGMALSLIMSQDTAVHLAPSQRDELAALTAVTDAHVYLADTTPETETAPYRLPLVMEIGDAHSTLRWAASQVEALAPTPSWGNGEGEAQFVRVYQEYPLPPLPATWRRTTAAALRAAVPGTPVVLPITHELDGSSRQFGRLAWQRLCAAAPQLHQQLVSHHPLAAIHYSDRYLRSPLTVALLWEFIRALAEYIGGLVGSTQVTVATGLLRRDDTQEPHWLHHDWQDATEPQSSGDRALTELRALHAA